MLLHVAAGNWGNSGSNGGQVIHGFGQQLPGQPDLFAGERRPASAGRFERRRHVSYTMAASAASFTAAGGSGAINFTVAASTATSSRSATIAAGGQSVTITQAAAVSACTRQLANTSAILMRPTWSSTSTAISLQPGPAACLSTP